MTTKNVASTLEEDQSVANRGRPFRRKIRVLLPIDNNLPSDLNVLKNFMKDATYSSLYEHYVGVVEITIGNNGEISIPDKASIELGAFQLF